MIFIRYRRYFPNLIHHTVSNRSFFDLDQIKVTIMFFRLPSVTGEPYRGSAW